MRILIVDSEPLIRWSICAALAVAGFDAVSAADADEARTLASEWPPPRVALLDVRYPDADAHQLLADIRGVYPDCRFLIMTTAPGGSGTDRLRLTGLEVIEKPFDLARIVEMVDRLAGDSGARKEPS